MKQVIYFSKYHGLGNDFLIIDGINQRVDRALLKQETIVLCNRRFGIGADGVILVELSESCDLQMTIFNADGSEPEMCGNGIRCFAQFVFDQKLIEKDLFSVETPAGKIVPALIIKDAVVKAIEVDMGQPQIDSSMMNGPDVVNRQNVTFDGKNFELFIVSMGNPHAVVFMDQSLVADEFSRYLKAFGQYCQTLDLFPNGVNLELVRVLDDNHITCDVWERGVGATLACGTGACASVVATVFSGKTQRKVDVKLPGGHLLIEWQQSDNHVIMTGSSTKIFEGYVIL